MSFNFFTCLKIRLKKCPLVTLDRTAVVWQMHWGWFGVERQLSILWKTVRTCGSAVNLAFQIKLLSSWAPI